MWGRFIEAVGFGNGRGELSYNKMVTFTALWTFVYCVVTRREPTWALLSFGVVVIGAGFGLKGYLGAIKQNTMTARTTVTADLTKMTETIVKQRDHDRGIDPA